jgi:hypothetical protein
MGNSITRGYKVSSGRGYVYRVGQQLECKTVNVAVSRSYSYALYKQSKRAKGILESNLLTGPGVVLATSGICELYRAEPSELDIELAYALANIQAIAELWVSLYPGTIMVILPPVENGSGVQGMSRAVTDAYLTTLTYPAVALDWYPQDSLHDYGTLDTWWADTVHPNAKGHAAMADAVMGYLNEG